MKLRINFIGEFPVAPQADQGYTRAQRISAGLRSDEALQGPR